jgi:hypothetical protein
VVKKGHKQLDKLRADTRTSLKEGDNAHEEHSANLSRSHRVIHKVVSIEGSNKVIAVNRGASRLGSHLYLFKCRRVDNKGGFHILNNRSELINREFAIPQGDFLGLGFLRCGIH